MSHLVRPLRPGASISQKGFGGGLGGTLGCLVEEVETKEIMLLSNMHILQFFQRTKSLFTGYSSKDASMQEEIVQPCGLYLREMAEERLLKQARSSRGDPRLYERFYIASATERTPLLATSTQQRSQFNQALDAEVKDLASLCTVATYARGFLNGTGDAAVARLHENVAWMNKTPDGCKVLPPPDNYAIYPGQMVKKFGNASGKMRYGVITKLDAKIKVPFTVSHEESLLPSSPMKGLATKVTVEMKGMIEVQSTDKNPFQLQGDSGSALLDAHGHLIGLMSTGGMGKLAYAVPIDRVFDTLGVTFPSQEMGW